MKDKQAEETLNMLANGSRPLGFDRLKEPYIVVPTEWFRKWRSFLIRCQSLAEGHHIGVDGKIEPPDIRLYQEMVYLDMLGDMAWEFFNEPLDIPLDNKE